MTISYSEFLIKVWSWDRIKNTSLLMLLGKKISFDAVKTIHFYYYYFLNFLLNTIFINSSSGAWFEGVWGAEHPLSRWSDELKEYLVTAGINETSGDSDSWGVKLLNMAPLPDSSFAPYFQFRAWQTLRCGLTHLLPDKTDKIHPCFTDEPT